MAKKKTKFEIKDWYYLSGPFALVAFFLVDVIGGFNFPGYDWSSMVIDDLLAVNSHSFPYALTFAIIYTLLSIFAAYCIFQFIKKSKFNKLVSRGVKLFLIAAIVSAVGLTVFVQPEHGTFDKVKDNGIIAVKDEVIDSDSDVQETQEVFDLDATLENVQTVWDMIANPLVIGNFVCSIAVVILSIISLIFLIIGGFKKGGSLLFAAVAIFCLVLILYSNVAFIAMDNTLMGINSRFAFYAIVAFLAFLGSYIYITDVKE